MAATAATVFTLLIAGHAWAQENDPCAGLTGKAKGLCVAYSKGMGCSSDNPNANEKACGDVATLFEEVTGSPPPSDCPCDFSLERIKSEAEGFTGSDYRCNTGDFFDPVAHFRGFLLPNSRRRLRQQILPARLWE